jgi:hypothetical protein
VHNAEALRKRLQGTKDIALERVVNALRDPLTLDNVRAEWVANQLLESGEKGILLPASLILDSYIRGKSRYNLSPLCEMCTCSINIASCSQHSFSERPYKELLMVYCMSRYYLRKHALRTTAYVAASCALVHLAKQGFKKATRQVNYVGPAVQFICDVALPTPIVGPLLMARFLL